jgi:hypothetical protein
MLSVIMLNVMIQSVVAPLQLFPLIATQKSYKTFFLARAYVIKTPLG